MRSGHNISVSGKIYLLIITKIKNYLCDYSFQAQWDCNSSIETGEASLSSSAKFFRVGCYSCQKCITKLHMKYTIQVLFIKNTTRTFDMFFPHIVLVAHNDSHSIFQFFSLKWNEEKN